MENNNFNLQTFSNSNPISISIFDKAVIIALCSKIKNNENEDLKIELKEKEKDFFSFEEKEKKILLHVILKNKYTKSIYFKIINFILLEDECVVILKNNDDFLNRNIISYLKSKDISFSVLEEGIFINLEDFFKFINNIKNISSTEEKIFKKNIVLEIPDINIL